VNRLGAESSDASSPGSCGSPPAIGDLDLRAQEWIVVPRRSGEAVHPRTKTGSRQ
jgi:hypothetical protein